GEGDGELPLAEPRRVAGVVLVHDGSRITDTPGCVKRRTSHRLFVTKALTAKGDRGMSGLRGRMPMPNFSRIISLAYMRILERPPDPGGLDNYNRLMNDGLTEAMMRESLLRSAEYAAKNPDRAGAAATRTALAPNPGRAKKASARRKAAARR